MTPTEIREARASLGLTQKEFAELLHSTDRTVRMWESGQRNMQPVTQDLLSRILSGRSTAQDKV